VEATRAGFVFAVKAHISWLVEEITADFVYYRLRKPEYTEKDVDGFAARAKELLVRAVLRVQVAVS
jgi:hypothetical protein